MWYEDHSTPGAGIVSWALLPNANSNQTNFWQEVDPDKGYPYWARNLLIVAITQGFLTLGLHGCEVVINVIRDEAQWRLATSAVGMRLLRNPILSQLSNWPNVALLILKPLLREYFWNFWRGEKLTEIQIGCLAWRSASEVLSARSPKI